MKIKTNGSFENVTQLKCLVPPVRGRNLIREEIKTKLNSGNFFVPFGPETFVSTSAV
jgi:hypothetical protein